MNPALLEALIKEGESTLVEFKIAPPRPAELAERLCGFANALGGSVIIGVKDQTWEVVGLQNTAEAVDILLKAARLCKPPVQFVPPQPQVVSLGDKKLVIATIPPNNGTLHQASGSFLVRRGTHTIPLSLEEIEAQLYNTGSLSWEKRPVRHATLEDLNMELVSAYLTRRSARTRVDGSQGDLAEALIRLDCAVRNGEVVRPTNAGLLIFGLAPQEFLAQAEIICGVFSSSTGSRGLADRRALIGPITEQINQAEAFLKLYIPVSARIEGFNRIDEPDYPLPALREAVVNAIAHRDYSLEGQAVRIFIYPGDHIDIYSPGGLVPGIKLEELQQGHSFSRPRNPLLVNLLRDLPGNYMERMGLGVNFMIGQMRELNRPAPLFREAGGEFCVTFQRNLAEQVISAPAEKNVPVEIPAELPKDKDVEEGLTQSGRQELALRYVRERGFITNREYCDLTRVGDRTALRDLEALVEQGALQATGQKRGRRYLLP